MSIKDETKRNTFTSTDIYFCASLVSLKQDLADFYVSQGKTHFVFNNFEVCTEFHKDWLTDTLEVRANSYVQAFKYLKSIVYGGQSNVA